MGAFYVSWHGAVCTKCERTPEIENSMQGYRPSGSKHDSYSIKCRCGSCFDMERCFFTTENKPPIFAENSHIHVWYLENNNWGKSVL